MTCKDTGNEPVKVWAVNEWQLCEKLQTRTGQTWRHSYNSRWQCLKVASGHSRPPTPQSAVALLLLPFRLKPDNKERDVFSRQVFAGLFLLSTGAERSERHCVCLFCLLSLSYSLFFSLAPPHPIPSPPVLHIYPSALQGWEREDGVLQSRFSCNIGHARFWQQDQDPLKFVAT